MPLKTSSKKTNSTAFYLIVLAAAFLILNIVLFQSDINIFELARSAFASTPSVVTIQQGRLYVDGQRFDVKGVNYNPTTIGSDQLDATAPASDVLLMHDLGANTIGTYISGKFDWDQWTDVNTGETFYNNLYPVAEQYDMKIIVSYFANDHVDWTNSTQVARLTTQYQSMVNNTKARPSTLMYMIGNELFEKLSNDAQKRAYAEWVGDMVDWTHTNDANHPVMYADRGDQIGLTWLKTYAPNLDIYGVNNYSFTSAASAESIIAGYANSWPGKAILFHEWGSDSYDVANGSEAQVKQGDKIKNLAQYLDTVSATSSQPFLGGLLFEYTDEYRFVGSLSTQDPDAGWTCASCFDGKANEDYWGISKNVLAGSALNRSLKSAYYSLKEVWGGTVTPPAPSDTTAPVVQFTSPVNGSLYTKKTKLQFSVTASDNVKVTKVLFYYPSGTLKCTDLDSPYHCTISLPAKAGVNVTVTAKAYDNAGNIGTSTVTVTTK